MHMASIHKCSKSPKFISVRGNAAVYSHRFIRIKFAKCLSTAPTALGGGREVHPKYNIPIGFVRLMTWTGNCVRQINRKAFFFVFNFDFDLKTFSENAGKIRASQRNSIRTFSFQQNWMERQSFFFGQLEIPIWNCIWYEWKITTLNQRCLSIIANCSNIFRLEFKWNWCGARLNVDAVQFHAIKISYFKYDNWREHKNDSFRTKDLDWKDMTKKKQFLTWPSSFRFDKQQHFIAFLNWQAKNFHFNLISIISINLFFFFLFR